MKKFDTIYSLIVIFIVTSFFVAFAYLALTGTCMARAKGIYKIQSEDSFNICIKQIGAFR